MVTVELFEGLPFNGSNKMSNFANATAQETYFSSIPESSKLTLTDVKFTKLGEPILLEKTIDELYPYTYGRMKLNESTDAYNNWYYFSIDHYEVERTNKTWVYFIIDYWETYRYSHTAGSTNKLQLGRSRISRCSLDLGCRIMGAFTHQFTKQKKISEIVGRPEEPTYEKWYNAIATYHVNSTNKDYLLSVVSTRRMSDLIGFNWSQVPLPTNMGGGNVDPGNIMGYWFSPFEIQTLGAQIWAYDNQNPQLLSVYAIELSTFAFTREDRILGSTHNEYEIDFPEQPNERSRIGVTDAMGNLVWMSDIGNYGPKIKMCLNVTMTTARWLCYIQRDGVYTNGECMFTIPCEPMDLYSDAFVSYYTQQRPFVERQRQIQKDEAAMNGVSNIASSMSQGAMVGMLGGPATALAGAVAGLVGSTVGVGLNYMTADAFNKAYQRNEDAQARMQSDNLRFEGCGLSDYVLGYTHPSFVEIEKDEVSWNSYVNDINSFGYFYDTEYPNTDNLLAGSVPEFKLTCSCEVENVPAVAERSIKNRLSAGVQFIRP